MPLFRIAHFFHCAFLGAFYVPNWKKNTDYEVAWSTSFSANFSLSKIRVKKPHDIHELILRETENSRTRYCQQKIAAYRTGDSVLLPFFLFRTPSSAFLLFSPYLPMSLMTCPYSLRLSLPHSQRMALTNDVRAAAVAATTSAKVLARSQALWSATVGWLTGCEAALLRTWQATSSWTRVWP